VQQTPRSLDHLVGNRKHVGRNCKAERPSAHTTFVLRNKKNLLGNSADIHRRERASSTTSRRRSTAIRPAPVMSAVPQQAAPTQRQPASFVPKLRTSAWKRMPLTRFSSRRRSRVRCPDNQQAASHRGSAS
jgi:hypothetical protein